MFFSSYGRPATDQGVIMGSCRLFLQSNRNVCVESHLRRHIIGCRIGRPEGAVLVGPFYANEDNNDQWGHGLHTISNQTWEQLSSKDESAYYNLDNTIWDEEDSGELGFIEC